MLMYDPAGNRSLLARAAMSAPLLDRAEELVELVRREQHGQAAFG